MVTSFEALNGKSREFLESTMTSLSAVTQGLQTIAGEAADYSKASIEDGTALLVKLASVKSPEQAFQTQNAFSKTVYESFVAQTTKFGELYADLAREAYRPYEAAVAKIGR